MSTRARSRRGAGLVLALSVLAGSASVAGAQPLSTRRRDAPTAVTGVVRDEEEPGDLGREAANVLLFLPRTASELFFVTTGAAAGLIEDEQVVPRVDDLLHPPDGEVRIFPTLFMETGTGVNVGARVIGRADGVATTVRAGYGGAHDVVAESRVRLSFPEPLPFALALEALHDERSSLGYRGLGQEPESDPRNRFAATAPSLSATYREQRERIIASAGVRPFADTELFLSGSTLRRVDLDPVDQDGHPIREVFEPGTVAGANRTNQQLYTELALRIDTRPARAGPATGFLFEAYHGRGEGIRDTAARFLRAGGRTAAFFSVVEPSNVLSPKLVLDGLGVLRGPVPFTELPRQPDFRGFDDRRDYVSLVGSLDYRWTLMRYLAARVFTDGATVAPRVSELSLDGLRWAAGFGFDVFSRNAQLGSLSFSGSPEGYRFFFLFGVSSSFGDRQHRG